MFTVWVVACDRLAGLRYYVLCVGLVVWFDGCFSCLFGLIMVFAGLGVCVWLFGGFGGLVSLFVLLVVLFCFERLMLCGWLFVILCGLCVFVLGGGCDCVCCG